VFSVCLIGGESSGKSTLAQDLHAHLQTRGQRCALVPEQLRAWCRAMGRAPLAHEQAARAADQGRANALALGSDADIVVADTSALVIAAYSELYFKDLSLWPAALAEQRRFGLTLLMGLDLPWVADGLFRDSPAHREATDALLRRELIAADLPFQTIYGQGPARCEQALRALGRAMDLDFVATDVALQSGRGRWTCESCSDPDCEHRLFSALLKTKETRR
jgi:HTH-type transcriptional repressor of NAD biosynthesis genes